MTAEGQGLVFLASTPSGGAGWLGEALNAHSQLLCPPEPWLLLPIVSLGQRRLLAAATYDHPRAEEAIAQALPPELQDQAVAAYAATAYGQLLAAAGKSVFVDRTARYYHVLHELARLFPAAKWIWLKRNPLDVIAACKETVGLSVGELTGEPLSPHSFDVGLALSRYAAHFGGSPERCFALTYEDLAREPAPQLERLCGFLDVAHEPAVRLGKAPDAPGRWRELLLPEEVATAVRTLGSDLFETLGYADELKAARKLAGLKRGSVVPAGTLPQLADKWSAFTQRDGASLADTPAGQQTLLVSRYQEAAKLADERLQLMNQLETTTIELRRQLDASRREVEALQKLAEDRLYALKEQRPESPAGGDLATGALAESLDRARLDISFEERLRAAEDARNLAVALAEARYRIIQQQDRDIWLHRMVHPRELARALTFPRLGVLYQYMPRVMNMPERYGEAQPPDPAPTISIVTPTLNQGTYLEKTIQSVLEQKYPALEYIVQDGASRDSTPQVLERYASVLAHVDSHKDTGQSNAINLGFAHATGEIMAYLNSDDLLLPGAVNYVAAYFARHPEVDVVYGHRIVIDDVGNEIGRWVLPPHTDAVLKWADFIPQETLFWRRRIWEKVGGSIDESFRFAMDWDLVLRFWSAGARFARLPRFLGAFRYHPDQKTSAFMEGLGEGEMARLRQRCHGHPVTNAQISLAVLPYLLKHVACHYLYRLRILRY